VEPNVSAQAFLSGLFCLGFFVWAFFVWAFLSGRKLPQVAKQRASQILLLWEDYPSELPSELPPHRFRGML